MVSVQSPKNEKTVLDNQFNLINGPLKSDCSLIPLFLNYKGHILSIYVCIAVISECKSLQKEDTFLNL